MAMIASVSGEDVRSFPASEVKRGRRRSRRPGRRILVVPMRFLAAFALAAGLCAWTGDARAQGSAETDRAALVAVYRATGGNDWTNNTNWLSAAPLEDWYGVEVNRDGRVTRLRLGGWDETVRSMSATG